MNLAGLNVTLNLSALPHAVNVPSIGYGSRPVLYVASMSRADEPGWSGPGRRLSIMANRRAYPNLPRVSQARIDVGARYRLHAGDMGFLRFKDRCIELISTRAERGAYMPGRLFAVVPPAWIQVLVEPGDTLVCGCASLDDRCHRTWLAPYLVASGWRVILDGRDLV